VHELLSRRALARAIVPGLTAGTVSRRLVHNDAKIANVLFDPVSGRARWVVDLDTVMPGSVLHDFGDLVRSSVAPVPEDAPDQAADPDLFEALATGFLRGAGDALAPGEVELLETAGRLITYEQAVRFLTDHLAGDRYYRVATPGHNLVRARAQLALLRSLERQAATMAAIVARAAGG
jgi:N-acetylhexosamine 1-kinase